MSTELHPTRKRIVVGVDGSEQSKLALTWAARIAMATGAQIDALIAWHLPAAYGWNYFPDDWSPERDAARCLEQTVEEVFQGGRPAGMRLLVREGGAAKALLDASAGATMLIVGSRGHGGFAGLLLGSVSSGCAEHATCPVLVVHDGIATGSSDEGELSSAVPDSLTTASMGGDRS